MPFGVSLNPDKFRRNMVLLFALATAKKEVWPIFDNLGQGRFEALIEKNKPFLSAIPFDQLPDKWQGWIAQAPQYRNLLSTFDETMLLALVPEWMQHLVMRDDKSKRWFLDEAEWLKAQFNPPPAPLPRRRVFKAVEKKEEVPDDGQGRAELEQQGGRSGQLDSGGDGESGGGEV